MATHQTDPAYGQAGQAIVQLVEEQHQWIRGQMDLVQQTHGSQRAEAFLALRRYIAAHEASEQFALHPALGDPENVKVVAERIEEDAAATAAIEQLEQFDVDSSDFEQQFAELSLAVVAHAEAEEHQELTLLLGRMSDDDASQAVSGLRRVEALVGMPLRDGAGGAAVGFAAMLATAEREVRTS